jgi:hypothetical protein
VQTILASGRSRSSATRFLFLVAAVAALVLGVAGTAAAASPTFTQSLVADPGAGNVAYSTADQPAYVGYTITFTRGAGETSNLSHARISAPVNCDALTMNCPDSDFPSGATIVSVSGDCPTPVYRDAMRGVSCDIASPQSGVPITIKIVVQTPPSGGATAIANQAALTVDEGGNDAQPNAKNEDTFGTAQTVTQLTSDTSGALNTFTNPNSTGFQTFATDKHLGATNPQSTQATLHGGVGVGVGLAETNFGSNCPGTASGLTCFGQLSTITVEQSGAGGPFACVATNLADANCLQFTVVVAGSTLGFSVNTKKVTIYHTTLTGTFPVPFCSTGHTDTGTSAGDCIVSIVQDSKTKNITWVARGPSNGGWGGAG